MSSWRELYSDFLDQVKVYTEKLEVTPVSFMRAITRGINLFQRETLLVEAKRIVTLGDNGYFNLPEEMLLLKEVKDSYGRTLLIQKYVQLTRNMEKSETGLIENSTDYSMRLRPTPQWQLGSQFNNNVRESAYLTDKVFQNSRMVSYWGRKFVVFPDYGTDEYFTVWYIPDLHAFSEWSPQWYPSKYNVTDPDLSDWFPLSSSTFETNFNETSLVPDLRPYEYAFLQFAVAQYIQSHSNANYIAFMKEFKDEIQRGIINKPTIFREGAKDYFMAPYS